EIAVLPPQPLIDERALAKIRGDDAVASELVGDVPQDRVRLPQHETVVVESGHTPVGVEREILGALLLARQKVDVLVAMGCAALLERRVNLARVERERMAVERDHARRIERELTTVNGPRYRSPLDAQSHGGFARPWKRRLGSGQAPGRQRRGDPPTPGRRR